jgi:hypothetical protein
MLCLYSFRHIKSVKKKNVVNFEMHIVDVNHMISSELCDREKECVREELSHLYITPGSEIK